MFGLRLDKSTYSAEAAKVKGIVGSIQDYTVHDGYGLRTLVFLKGCPLRCEWCQNPEFLSVTPEVVFRARLCLSCCRCIEVCPQGAITPKTPGRIDREKCTKCLKCAETCPSRALTVVGKEMTVEEVLNVVLAYKPFYDASDKGGVTVSGGEPFFQAGFLLKLLSSLKVTGIHTCVETSGFVDFSVLKSALPYIDLLLYDVKHMDESLHVRGTGVSNGKILKNLALIRSEAPSLEVIARIPLIPGFNDSTENVRRTCAFVQSLGIVKLDLLPFNDLASSKYNEMGIPWKYQQTGRQQEAVLADLMEVAAAHGLEVTIGGLR